MAGPAERTIRRCRVVAAIVVCAVAVPGCQTFHAIKDKARSFHFSSSYEDPLADTKMAEAKQLFADGQYAKAHDVFKQLADNTGNNAVLAEEARFLQAETRRLRGHYPDAVDVYHRL